MPIAIPKFLVTIVIGALLVAPGWLIADELTQQIQESLVELGYDPGNTDGESSIPTAIAIATYQAERDLEVTGEVSPVIAGIMAAEIRKMNAGSESGEVAAAPEMESTPAPAWTQEELQAAQEACLEEKIAEAEKKAKRSQGFSDLLNAVSKTASMTGDTEVAQTTGTVYTASSTAEDLSSAAKNLGLTEDDIKACENPPDSYFD
jgi:peptidoglycan hydrolase-like protein with peptidoglycan-binding domain